MSNNLGMKDFMHFMVMAAAVLALITSVSLAGYIQTHIEADDLLADPIVTTAADAWSTKGEGALLIATGISSGVVVLWTGYNMFFPIVPTGTSVA